MDSVARFGPYSAGLSQPDFIKIIGRFQCNPQAFIIYGGLLTSKRYFFAAFHLATTAGEPEIFTASKPFDIFSNNFLLNFLLTPTPKLDVMVTIATYML